MKSTGAYTADRASALAGVPKSTIHYWARNGILTPSVSPAKVKLWSFEDLIGLRTIHWLRRRKRIAGGATIPASTMTSIRAALSMLQEFGQTPWDPDKQSIFVDGNGRVNIKVRSLNAIVSVAGQLHMSGEIDLIEPFSIEEGISGPNLWRPRENLRIIPGKLGGSPHVENTRLDTRVIASLHKLGHGYGSIIDMYPFISEEHIRQAVDLEDQLAKNLSVKSAA